MLVMFDLNVFYLPTLKYVVGHNKLLTEVMFWLNKNCVLQCLHPIAYKARYVQKCKLMRFMFFSDKFKKESYSLFSLSVIV